MSDNKKKVRKPGSYLISSKENLLAVLIIIGVIGGAFLIETLLNWLNPFSYYL